MKTIVKANFDKTLYAVTIIPHDYKWTAPLNLLQETICKIGLDAKVISNDGHTEVITQIGKSAELDQIKAIQEAIISISVVTHDIDTSYTAFKDRLLGIRRDLNKNAKTESTSSPEKKDNSKGQKWKSKV